MAKIEWKVKIITKNNTSSFTNSSRTVQCRRGPCSCTLALLLISHCGGCGSSARALHHEILAWLPPPYSVGPVVDVLPPPPLDRPDSCTRSSGCCIKSIQPLQYFYLNNVITPAISASAGVLQAHHDKSVVALIPHERAANPCVLSEASTTAQRRSFPTRALCVCALLYRTPAIATSIVITLLSIHPAISKACLPYGHTNSTVN